MAPSKRETRSSYPNTPSSAGSAPFQYNSIVRPPTGYSSSTPSAHAISPPPPLPSLHDARIGMGPAQRRPHIRQVSTDGLLVHAEAEEEEDEANTPLYARSDWTKSVQPSARTARDGRETAYSDQESEYPQTTALPTLGDGRQTPMYAQSEWESQFGGTVTPGPTTPGKGAISPSSSAGNGNMGGLEVDDKDDAEAEKWEEKGTAWSKSSYAPRDTVLDTVYEDQLDHGSGAESGRSHESYHDGDQPKQFSPATADRVGGSAVAIKRQSSIYSYQPPPSSASSVKNGLHRRPSDRTNIARGRNGALLSPQTHQKLGRMSVAPARYTLPPTNHARRPSTISEEGSDMSLSGGSNPYAPTGGLRFQQNQQIASRTQDKNKGIGKGISLTPLRPDDILSRLKTSRIGLLYLTYRPFITTAFLLMSAMMLTLAMQSGGSLGTFVKLQQGGFGGKIGEGTSGAIGLGIGGWCQLETEHPICKTYRTADFVASSTNFQIPGPDSHQGTLNYLFAALTGLTWLLATYHLTIAFLHFFLLFGLSIPWDFFTTSDPLPPLTGVPQARPKSAEAVVIPNEDEIVQKEVDLRVRCERPPYEAYEWVWWAWWAHRRGPVGHAFVLAVGVLGLCATGVSAAFYMQVKAAVADNKASVAAGTLVPVICLIFCMDPIILAIKYLVHARYNFETFNAPPSPSPAAVLLPPNTRPMRHIRNTGAASYFADQEDPMQIDTIFAVDPSAPPVPPLPSARTLHAPPIDPETVRWLAAYPLDPDLVSLISDLRAGKESEDFVLSDVGLLYLRPDPEVGDEGGDALLVPPAGQIRAELLNDAHFEVVEGGEEGGSAHWGPETMLSKMGETFWWPGIEEDCRALVEGCARCVRDGVDDLQEVELKPGMTPLPFTGMQTDGAMTGMMTGPAGQSAVAADMAFAMRKAQDEARRDVLSP